MLSPVTTAFLCSMKPLPQSTSTSALGLVLGSDAGVERAAERLEVAARVRAHAADAAEREGQMRLGVAGRRPAVLGHAAAVEQAKAQRPFREREPRARLRAVRTIAAARTFAEVEVGL